MVTMVTTKYHSRIPDVSDYSSVKFYIRIRSTDGNIRECLLLNCALIISNVTQSVVNIFGSFVVFSRKIVQILIFKVEYLENSLTDFNDFGLILQDCGRPFR